MDKKKVLYIHHGKGLGGAPLSLLYLIQALDKQKYEPIVLFLHYSEAVDLYMQNGIKVMGIVNLYDFSHTKVWWFKWYHLPYFWRSFKDTLKTLFFDADNWLDKINPDIVHLNTSSLIAWGCAAYKKNIPVVWHIREPLADGYLGIRKKVVKSCVARYSSAILPICKHDSQPWQQNDKTCVIYNAVDSNKFNFNLSPKLFLCAHKLNPSNPKILFLGGLSYEKGIDVILRAFDCVLQRLPQAQLLLAGYFEPYLKPNSFCKRFFPSHQFKKNILGLYKRLENNVVLLGATQQIPDAMASSDVTVFPANFGHFARPIIEAGFMKKPVIASNFAPLDELVLHEKTGFLIPPTDIDLWAEKLFLLLTNHSLNKKMGEAGYDFCSKNFGLKDQINKIEKIYSDLMRFKNNFNRL